MMGSVGLFCLLSVLTMILKIVRYADSGAVKRLNICVSRANTVLSQWLVGFVLGNWLSHMCSIFPDNSELGVIFQIVLFGLE